MTKLLVILFFAIFATVLGYSREKLSRRPPSQPRFNLDRWLGRWYLQARLASCSWYGSNEFQEWTQMLSLNNGKVLSSETWYNDVCVTTSAILTQSQRGRGCFIVQDAIGDVWTGEQVIPATDYKKFSISWGCVKKSLDGKRCDDTWITVKTRRPYPSPYTWKVVEAILKKLFDLSLTDMKRISHDNSKCSGGQNLVEMATSLGATTLVNFAKEASLAGTLADGGPFTVFAPTNAAFDALPPDVKATLSINTALLKKVLQFHVLPGQILSNQLSNELTVKSLAPVLEVRINIYGDIVTATGSKVIDVDKKASNGVIHVIDRVMFPLPVGPLPEVASRYPELSTFLLAVDTAGLGGALSGRGPFTVFGPTNKAFKRLPPGVLDNLLENPDALADVLNYHVIPGGTFYSAGLTSGGVTTIQGGKINIRVTSDGVRVNSARVINADIPASNGVLHIIDEVLLP